MSFTTVYTPPPKESVHYCSGFPNKGLVLEDTVIQCDECGQKFQLQCTGIDPYDGTGMYSWERVGQDWMEI